MLSPKFTLIKNGNNSPLPSKVKNVMKFKNASPSGDYLSNSSQSNQSLDSGSQGNTNAARILGFFVG